MLERLTIPERKLITVLHLDHENAPLNMMYLATVFGELHAIVELYNLGLYRKVAIVLCDRLDDAVESTQDNWDSRVVNRGILRNTMAGDILVVGGQDAYSVGLIGFEPLPIIMRDDHRSHI